MSQRDAEERMQRMRAQGRLLESSNPLCAPLRLPLRLSALKKQDRKIRYGRMASAIALMGSCAIAFFPHRALAQSNIVPDATLGAERSFVVPNFNGLPVEAIGGGALRGQNLFHSFQEFNVSEGRGAYFFSPNAAIQNILARVTGNNPSQILGTLGTFGNSQPNLFLINPNGIIFGPNASLDVGGSFVATTANAIRLGNTGLFSASAPQTSNLLAINPNAFFYNQLSNQGQIVNRSTATTTVLGTPTSGLQVPDGQSLLLIGGDVRLEGGLLFAPGGRIELGGVAQNGTVELTANGNELRLGFPADVARSDVSLTNQAEVNVRAGGGGSIAINARNVEVLGGSKVRAGIASGLGTPESKAGDIEVNATGTMTVAGELSFLANAVLAAGVGKGGDVNITTGSLFVTDGGQVNALTRGYGNAGSVTINARDQVLFDGVASNGDSSGVSSTVAEGAVGNGGGININAESLSLTNGAQLQAFVSGTSFNKQPGVVGNGGRVNINVRDKVTITGESNSGLSSGIFTYLGEYAQGNAGSIDIKAGSFLLGEGATLDASMGYGSQGDGGSISVQAGSISLRDGATISTTSSGTGNSGSILLQADGVVSLVDSEIDSSKPQISEGNAGNITIKAGSLLSSNTSFDAGTQAYSGQGRGNAGDILIQITGSAIFTDSSIETDVNFGSAGNGGDITISGSSLSFADTYISSETRTGGTGGNVSVQADSFVSLASTEINSGNFNDFTEGGVAGDISIRAGSLSLTDESKVIASTVGRQDGVDSVAGSINIHVDGAVSLENSSILSQTVYKFGNGGRINLNAGSLSLTDSAEISTSTSGQGNAGSVFVKADDSILLTNGSVISSLVRPGAVGTGGDIDIRARSLTLTNGGQLNASVLGADDFHPGAQGRGGNIYVNAADFVNLSGVSPERTFDLFDDRVSPPGASSGIYSSTQRGASGRGGEIFVNTSAFRVADGAVVNAQTLNPNDGGNITINTDIFEAVGGGQVLTTTFSSGKAGTVTIASTDSVTLSGQDPQFEERLAQFGGDVVPNAGSASGIFANTASNATGAGGDVEVTTGQFTIQNGAQVTVSSPSGQAGNMSITADSLTLNRGTISAVTGKSGAEGGANITIQGLDLLRMDNESLISASALKDANGGNVTIDSTFIVATPPTGSKGSDITANAVGGNGGRVKVTTQGLFGIEFRPKLTPDNDITASSDFGIAGIVDINTPGVDPSRGLSELPSDVINATQQIDRRCTPAAADQKSSFVITGRGGLPPSPNDTLQAESVITHWVTLDSQEENTNSTAPQSHPTRTAPKQLVEAQSWVYGANGEVILTAEAATPHSSWQIPPSCDAVGREEKEVFNAEGRGGWRRGTRRS